MHKSATKCNEKVGKWCKNKHGASKIIDTLETYHEVQTVRYDCQAMPGILLSWHFPNVDQEEQINSFLEEEKEK
jgi:hypothetical protein